MDPSGLRARTTLVCGALALAIAVSMLLRGRVRKEHVLFAAFAGDIGLWYLSQSLFGFFQAPVWERLRVVLALLLPLLAIELFEAMVPAEDGRRSRLGRIGALVASPIVILVIVQQHRAGPVGVVVLLYVFAMSTAALWELGQRGARSHSRATQRRVRLLVIIGVLAGLGSAGDFAWVIGFDPPPVGVALTVVFVFVLGQAVLHRRLLDLGEMLSRLVVAIAMASLFAVFFYVLVAEIGQFNTMYVNAVLAAVIVLALFNPLHQKLEELIKRFVLRDPESLAASVAEACRKLTHVLELEEMGRVVVAALERSRSVTTAALYLRREDADGFERLAGLGAATPARLDGSEARPLWEKLEQGALLLEPLAQQIREQRQRGSGPHPDEAVLCAADVLGSPLSTGVVLGVRAEDGELLGLLGVTDERIREAFSPEDVAQLELLAGQIGAVVEIARANAKMKERERLAALGQIAAGLAHEIRNPLGAIKGAAQLLADPAPGGAGPDPREFLGIILQEVDRLDQVVGSVLDLARPDPEEVAAPIDVGPVVQRTLQILAPEWGDDGALEVSVELGAGVAPAAIAPERLMQVVMNLARNAVQAMGGRGRLTVTTRRRAGGAGGRGLSDGAGEFVEIAVADTGAGIPAPIMPQLFQPFFTTKDKGTGLGLAICQRIVRAAAGRIEVHSSEGCGATFAVVLPAVHAGAPPCAAAAGAAKG